MSPSGASPLLAALVSIPFPGMGHFYCGRGWRGAGLMLGAFLSLPIAVPLSPWLGAVVWLGVAGFSAYDAWNIAGGAPEAVVPAGPQAAWQPAPSSGAEPPAPPGRALLWAWALSRSWWIALLALWAAGTFLSAAASAAQGGWVGALLALGLGGLVSYLAWRAVRFTYRGVRGDEPVTAALVRGDLGVSTAVFLLLALMAAIVAPYFSGLFRKSAEGAQRGRLGELRAALVAYRQRHGRAPDSLEALLAEGAARRLPSLWARAIEVPHEDSSAAAPAVAARGGDTGRWGYEPSSDPAAADGTVFIDCSHTDFKGTRWDAY